MLQKCSFSNFENIDTWHHVSATAKSIISIPLARATDLVHEIVCTLSSSKIEQVRIKENIVKLADYSMISSIHSSIGHDR